MGLSSFNLRFKFITGVVLFALALGLCISVIMYFHFNSILESEISQRARMLLAQSNAIQDYVKDVLRPEMFKILPEGRFILQAMSSSHISRQIMGGMNTPDTLEYHYRRVSMNPRNPDSRANAFEMRIIKLFHENPYLEIWEDNTMVNDKPYHMVARPVVFTDSCMQCHGNPGDAPGEMIEIYGKTSGFNYSVGDLAGVVVAGFPVDMIRGPALDLTLHYLSLYLLGILLFASMISLLFDRLVMKNLRALSGIFKTRFSGEQEQGIIHRLSQKDEIEGLIEGVDELAVCLSTARIELEGYAQNLEKRVEDRTQKLHLESKRHLSDVHLFVRLLSGFSGFQNTAQLISGVVESVGKRFCAAQVAYFCTVASENYYTWKKGVPVEMPDKKIQNLLWTDEILLQNNHLHVPIKSPETHWGILSISWATAPDIQDLDSAVLLALGHQIAILIENIHAFSSIRFQNDMLQSVFEGICDPLLLIDLEGHIIIANRGCDRIFPDSRRSAQEASLKKLLGEKSMSHDTETILDQVIKREKPVTEEVKTRDNRYLSVDLYPLPRQDQLGLRIVVYIRDITHEKKIIEKMQQTERLSAIGKLAAGIAHEINNPLGVIQLYTDLVKDAVDDADIHDDLDIISKHTRSVQKIIQNLLNLSRSKKVLSGRCNVNAVVRSLVEVFKAQGASKNVLISLDLADNLPDIKCDAAILEQILTNLWLNAFDALAQTDGQISITTRFSPGKQVELSMEDNGQGIPEAVIPHIFDPFYTTKEIGKGTGLGLSVVYGFVNELGGHIDVKSNDGTRFCIRFPQNGPGCDQDQRT